MDRLHAVAQHTLAQATAEEQRIRHALYNEGQILLKTARQDLDATLAVVRQQAPAGTVIAFPQEAWQRVVQTVESLAPTATETPAVPLPLQVGEHVRVRGLNVTGHLLTPVAGSGNVQVDVGGKTITVAAAGLERATEQGEKTPPTSTGRPARSRRRAAAVEELSPSCICSGRRSMRRCLLLKSISIGLSPKGCPGSILCMALGVGGCARRLLHSWSIIHWYGVFRPAMPVAVRPLLNSKDKLVSQLIPEEVVQEVLLRTDIVDVIGDYVQLKRTGANAQGLCPFHQEKTPSFSVTPLRGFFIALAATPVATCSVF